MFAGKLFYHIISTEAHRALQEGTAHGMQRYQQLENSMRTTLTALADRFQALTPAQIEKIKAKVRARQLRQQQQQQQQTMLVHGVPPLGAAASPASPPPAAAAATGAAVGAAVAAGGQLQLLQPSLHPSGRALSSQAQPDGGSSSAFPQWGSSIPPLQHPQLGDSAAADAGAIVAAGCDDAFPIAGSSTSSNSGSRLAGHKRQHSSSSNGSRWSDDVLWILHHYCLFHTSWSSPRSPPYNGLLLEQIAAELFGANFKVRSAV
jgi:hypothetical protein